MITGKLTPEERREFVARGLRAGKSNRAIAKELVVDEGTVRRDRKYLETPEHEWPVKKERPKKPKKVKPLYDRNDAASIGVHARRVSKELKFWVEEERILFAELEDVVHGASKHLHLHRESLRDRIPVPTQWPEDLLLAARPSQISPDELIPSPDFWARWLARWLALCLPEQEEFQTKVLRETLDWARTAYSRFVYWSHV